MIRGTLLLLHHVGARTGTPRVNPLMYRRDGDRYVVFASKAGAPTSPDWYHNLKAHPNVKIEVGAQTIDVTAGEATTLTGSSNGSPTPSSSRSPAPSTTGAMCR